MIIRLDSKSLNKYYLDPYMHGRIENGRYYYGEVILSNTFSINIYTSCINTNTLTITLSYITINNFYITSKIAY